MLPSYSTSGDPDASPLVLSHSLATDRAMWEGLRPVLEPHFRLVLYDARGHGETPAPDGPFALEDLVGDIIDLLDHLGIEETNFAGLSMGGMVGLGLALDHPERVTRLAVCDARADAPDAYVASWEDRIKIVTEQGFPALVAPTIERWFTPAFLADSSRVDRMRRIVERTTPEGYISCARALQGLDYKRRLRSMTVPTLYLVGDADAGAPPAEMSEMRTLTPGSRFCLIEGAGHISAVERPEAVAQAFLEHFGTA